LDDDRSGAGFAERCAPAVREYVAGVCGPDAPARILEDALARIAAVAESVLPPPEEKVRNAARQAAIGEVTRSTKRSGTWLRHALRGHPGHGKVPELLGRRAAGQMSTPDVRRLYAAVDRCAECGLLAARLEAAEWHLKLALHEIHETFDPNRTVAGPPGDVASGPSIEVEAAIPPAARTPAVATTARHEVTGGVSPPSGRRPAAPSGHGRWRPTPLLIVIGLLLGAAGDAAALLAFDGPGVRHASAQHPPTVLAPAPLIPLVPSTPELAPADSPDAWILG
jgi:hypothetical protein